MDYEQIYRNMTTPQLIEEAWALSDLPNKQRDFIVSLLMQRQNEGDIEAWPSAAMAARDAMAGLYPDPADPQFAARLFSKKEFFESRAVAAAVADGSLDPCTSSAAASVFELTPVQRIVSRFLNPATPYLGMLLFHGVGVGKTCSAVTIAEQFLEVMPHNKVIVLVPQALKENFKRTVFDTNKLLWTVDETGGRWSTQQCTGTSYLERLGLTETADLKTVAYKTEEDRRARYSITGYQKFANWIERTLAMNVPAGLTDPAARRAAEDEVLRRLFSDHLIIVDEAHNLRDTAADEGIGGGDAATAGDAADAAGGKALNPYLKRIVLNAEGLRLVFMTATPMYNSAQEILLLLNYLLMNDSKKEKAVLKIADFFNKQGDLTADPKLLRKFMTVVRRYVSYMRGENPYTFPLRMRPEAASNTPADMWPAVSATKRPVEFTEEERAAINMLPLVFTEPIAGSPPEQRLREATSRAQIAPDGKEVVLADAMLDARMQMANISYPNGLYGTLGWDAYFARQSASGSGHKLRIFSPKADFDVDSVFAGEGLRVHAPKMHRVVESIKAARGICFAYSRYIKAGALPLAIALERAGFQRRLADGRIAPLLVGAPSVAPVCAICGSTAHELTDHPFRPACYVLLTSDEEISPQFAGLVQRAANWSDDETWGPLGGQVKVVLGSQVASEGLDLKCVREMHILDAWYHLNRVDQIVGRAIRYCSHSALRAVEARDGMVPMSMNNCLIYLHAVRVGDTVNGEGQSLPAFETSNAVEGQVSGKKALPAFEPTNAVSSQVSRQRLPAFESADMYAYRIAIGKAMKVGYVQRLLKAHAWDCNLELEAIVFAGLPKRTQVDAQGRVLDEYSLDDQDFTTYCDYQACKYQCAVPADASRIDTSTFGIADARRILLENQARVRDLFRDQVVVPETLIQEIFSNLPWEIASEALLELLDGRKFRLEGPNGVTGFLIKKAGYVVFQPAAITDTDIPLTMRYARAFQLRRRFMEPHLPVFARAEEPRAPPMPVPVPVAAVPAPGPAPTPSMAKLQEWIAFVMGDGTVSFPVWMPSTTRIWAWILEHYVSVPIVKDIAIRWWIDKMMTYDERRGLYEFILNTEATNPEFELLNRLFTGDILRAKQVFGYRIYNPETATVDHYCRPTAMLAQPYTTCDSRIAIAMDRTLGAEGVPIPGGVGEIFGFLAAKKGGVVFKTFDTTKPKKHSTVGAECGNVSNLSEHQPRVRLLHAAGRRSELAPFMLPDDDASWNQAGLKERQSQARPEHMKDITHQPLCLYMEFLTRLLDAVKVDGNRWFLSATEATQSGLKGKK